MTQAEFVAWASRPGPACETLASVPLEPPEELNRRKVPTHGRGTKRVQYACATVRLRSPPEVVEGQRARDARGTVDRAIPPRRVAEECAIEHFRS